MSGRVIGWSTAAAVVLGGVQALAINKVDAGRGWQVAAAVLTVVCAGLAGWLAARSDSPALGGTGGVVRQGAGSVQVAGKVGAGVRTRVRGIPGLSSTVAQGNVLDAGAVHVTATGEVVKDISTDISVRAESVDGVEGGGSPAVS